MGDLSLVTIGVYGFTEEDFFSALTRASVDTFCDIRRRRGLRGAKYAFVNSKRLQTRLHEMGIQYVHMKDLSPTEDVRNLQKEADKQAGDAKRERSTMAQAFARAYTAQCLAEFDAREFVSRLEPKSRVVALFCVERRPEACHRSLLAQRIAGDLQVDVEHIVPCEC